MTSVRGNGTISALHFARPISASRHHRTPGPTMSRMDDIVSLCRRRGFIFQSSEIYGGINGFWDYGPLGA